MLKNLSEVKYIIPKICTHCDAPKPVNNKYFRRDKKRKRWHSWCRECENEYTRKHLKTEHGQKVLKTWRKLNPKKMRQYQDTGNKRNRVRRKEDPERFANYDLKKRIGITLEQKKAQLIAQEGKCAICQTNIPNIKGTWFADHDHKTKKFRGVLCGKCNAVLGYAEDNIDTLLSAAAYLGWESD